MKEGRVSKETEEKKAEKAAGVGECDTEQSFQDTKTVNERPGAKFFQRIRSQWGVNSKTIKR